MSVRAGVLTFTACAALLAALGGQTQAQTQSASPAPAPAQSADAQLSFRNGDVYRGGVDVQSVSPLPTQPDPGSVHFDGSKPPGNVVVPDGQGQLWFDGYVLTGTFKGGYAEGDGTLQGPAGFYLAGTFAHGALTQGTAHYLDGSTYQGPFANGCFAGRGTYRAKSGSEAVGVWKPVLDAAGTTCLGTLFSGRVTSPDRTQFFGSLDAQGRYDGPGHIRYPDGRRLAGTWVHGSYLGRYVETDAYGRQIFRLRLLAPGSILNGPGIYYVADGSRVEGHFHDGELKGPATLIDPAGVRHPGTVFDGQFKSDDGRYRASLDPFAGYTGERDSLGRPNGRGSLRYGGYERTTWLVTGTWRHGLMSGTMNAQKTDPGAPAFAVTVDPASNTLRGHARVIFPRRNFWEEGSFEDGALNGPGKIHFTSEPYCRLEGTFTHGDMRSAIEFCPGEDPTKVDIDADGTI